MWRVVIWVLIVVHGAAAIVMWAVPMVWYQTTPGVVMTGPFNIHFIRDVGLAFGLSSFALAWGVLRRDQGVAWFGCGFPALHALYHFGMWLGRGVPLDEVALVNLLGVQAPAWIGLVAVYKIFQKGRGL